MNGFDSSVQPSCATMSLTEATVAAVKVLERVQLELRSTNDAAALSNDVNTLLATLTSPMLGSMLTLRSSLSALKAEVGQHPSLLPHDFNIDPATAGLILRHNTTPPAQNGVEAPSAVVGEVAPAPGGGAEGEEDLLQLVREAAQGREVHRIKLARPPGSSLGFSVVGLRSEVRGELGIYVQGILPHGLAGRDGRLAEGDQVLGINGRPLTACISHHQAIQALQQATDVVDLVVARASNQQEAASSPLLADSAVDGQQQHQQQSDINALDEEVAIKSTNLDVAAEQQQQQIQQEADGTATTTADAAPKQDMVLSTGYAQVEAVELFNDGSGLGFGIIGGRSTGVVVKTILPGGVADRDGRLQSGDHILMIGEVSLRGLGSDQVASVLRQSGNHVRLIVARPSEHPVGPPLAPGRIAPIVETHLLTDPEELDRRLQVLAEGSVMQPPQIEVLPPPAEGAVVPPTLTIQGVVDPALPPDTVLPVILRQTPSMVAAETTPPGEAVGARVDEADAVVERGGELLDTGGGGDVSTVDLLSKVATGPPESPPLGGAGPAIDLPEMEVVQLELAKDRQGLGITIAGYVCEREELSGIFVKSVNAGSAADRSGRIQVNDQIVEVDGTSLSGLSNHHAVDVLRATGPVVRLRLARYLRGPKYEQLQQAIANSEMRTTPGTPNPAHRGQEEDEEPPSGEALRSALGQIEVDPDSSAENLTDPSYSVGAPYQDLSYTTPSTRRQHSGDTPAYIIPGGDVGESSTDAGLDDVMRLNRLNKNMSAAAAGGTGAGAEPPADFGPTTEDLELMIDHDYTGRLQPTVETSIKKKWSRVMGPDMEIVVCQLSKFEWGGGLGVSLEGTVDVEGGREVRPHHYIRSILPQGPVGRSGVLLSGDELLEVNGQKLLGLNHVEVVVILKELPRDVRIVCGRRRPAAPATKQDGEGRVRADEEQDEEEDDEEQDDGDDNQQCPRPLLGGSLQNLVPASERLVKAKSDGSLASSAGTGTPSHGPSFSRAKSRSLEPLTGLAMWGSTPHLIMLNKGDRGLGFSILDYQDPLNPQETVIVIRSLVPGGVAEKDGRLIPGDRLVSVNGIDLSNATLDEAVGALKGAPKGAVEIAVAKPISVLESPGKLDAILRDLPSSDSDVTLPSGEQDMAPSLPLHGSERLLDSGTGTPTTAAPPPSDTPFGGGATPRLPLLPRELQRALRIHKTAPEPLGISVDVSSSWAVVTSLSQEGVVQRHQADQQDFQRLQAGDVIVSVAGESLVAASPGQARAALKRAALATGPLSVVYVPRADADVFRTNTALLQQHARSQDELVSGSQPQLARNGLDSSLPRSETAPVFPSSGTSSRTNGAPPSEGGPTVINIQHSRTGSSVVEDRASGDAKVSSTHIGDSVPDSTSYQNESEEGPFTITFRNVSEKPLSRPPSGLHRQEEVAVGSSVPQSSDVVDHLPTAAAAGGVGSPTPATEASPQPPSMELDGSTNGEEATASQAVAKHWGPERVVQVHRDVNNSLGISIVGGQVELSWTGSFVNGIFIKNVLPDSPAGKSGLLKTGDRILEVEGTDLRNASHERAVEVIKNTGNPVLFVLQSLVRWTPASTSPSSRDSSRLEVRPPTAVPPLPRTPTPELIQAGLTDQQKQELQALRRGECGSDGSPSEGGSGGEEEDEEEGGAGSGSSDEEEEEDSRQDQGRVTSAGGEEIDRSSAGAMKKAAADTETEDQFGYTLKKISTKYKQSKGSLHLVDLQKGSQGLGISLSGHKDRSQMSVFVCGINPSGNAFKDGRIQVGDEVLEVNGNVVSGRCHLNASTVFKTLPGPEVKLIVLRRTEGLDDMAVKPLTHFPITLEDESAEEKYGRFKGLTNVIVKKGSTGLGIMIIEGKHTEYGQGIFISDLQEGSPAALAGLMVGDMILNVNKEEMVGADYEFATNILRKTEGIITLWVANAARTKEAKESEAAAATPASTDASAGGATPAAAPKAAPKPAEAKKPDEPPANPQTAPIQPGRETTIEIVKEKTGLGLSIVGGSDTLLKGAILIHEVYPDGAAAQDGRLRPGDQLLEVSGQNFRSITHQRALNVLRQTPAKGVKVQMVVYREEGGAGGGPAPREEDQYELITVHLTKKQGKGLGLSIVGRKNGPGVFISDLVEGGVAEGDGRLMQGDQILEVNSKDVRTATQEQAAAILKCAPGTVDIKLGRLKPGKRVAQETTRPLMITDSPSTGGSPRDSPTTPPPPIGGSARPAPTAHTIIPVVAATTPMGTQPTTLQQQQQQQQAAATAALHQLTSRRPPQQHEQQQQHRGVPPSAGTPGTSLVHQQGMLGGVQVPVTKKVAPGPIHQYHQSPAPPSLPAQQLPLPSSPSLPAQQLPLPTKPSSPSLPHSPAPREIVLERGDDGLGFSIVGGFGSNLGDLPIYVKSVFERGSAAREGSLRRGDQILEVNGSSLRGLTHARAVAVLKEAKGAVRMMILPAVK